MQKPCPRCKTMLRTMPQTSNQKVDRGVRGGAANPVILRCTQCRKNYEFKAGKLNPVSKH